ncbi:unnamed protein product [Linum trigynum]|uniref:Reverse transcriptase domain-containing protein n=1 Tax=Linum trigynum TaxID=586398 RepID=A0AAV2GTH7_9ROSI
MGKQKAPGLDGFTVLFFRRYWHVIGEEVWMAILKILETRVLPEGLNHTLIALIPKTKKPVSPKEFRPISLCNVLYKIISKVLANRLKTVLDRIISSEQSAFVPGRFITDNVMAAFECFHTMKKSKKRKHGFFAAKIDMAKTYDRVECKFLEGVMQRMGFVEGWIKLIMMGVTAVSYSVLVNGYASQIFVPSRGIWQGDPLSPYLFLLCAEGLSAYVTKAMTEGRLHGLQVTRGAPVITHLFFADDSILFARATQQESLELKRILQAYERESGQQVNYQKSEVSFATNVNPHNKLIVGGTLGMPIVEKQDKYLGLATEVGRSKKELFAGLKERVRKKLKGWKERTMSVAARETLIKSVAQAQLSYAMSVFKIPDGILDEIQSLIINFW